MRHAHHHRHHAWLTELFSFWKCTTLRKWVTHYEGGKFDFKVVPSFLFKMGPFSKTYTDKIGNEIQQLRVDKKSLAKS